MNDWNQWEQQLSGWVPRRPSARLKRRLFPSTPAVGQEMPWVVSWRWLAATASIMLVALIVSSQLDRRPVHASVSRSSGLLASLSLSNQSLASYYSPHRHSHQNAWSVVRSAGTFEWTNTSRSDSTTGSFLLLKTNSLIH